MWEDVLNQLKGVSVANESELGVSDILTSVQDSLSNIVSYEAADKPQIKVSNLTREHLRKVLTVFMGSGAYREDGTEYLTPYAHQGTGTVNQHTAGIDTHHRSRRQIGDCDAGLSNQLLRLIIVVNTTQNDPIYAGSVVQNEL